MIARVDRLIDYTTRELVPHDMLDDVNRANSAVISRNLREW
jgi:hypothetical protein